MRIEKAKPSSPSRFDDPATLAAMERLALAATSQAPDWLVFSFTRQLHTKLPWRSFSFNPLRLAALCSLGLFSALSLMLFSLLLFSPR